MRVCHRLAKRIERIFGSDATLRLVAYSTCVSCLFSKNKNTSPINFNFKKSADFDLSTECSRRKLLIIRNSFIYSSRISLSRTGITLRIIAVNLQPRSNFALFSSDTKRHHAVLLHAADEHRVSVSGKDNVSVMSVRPSVCFHSTCMFNLSN